MISQFIFVMVIYYDILLCGLIVYFIHITAVVLPASHIILPA